MIHNLNLNDRAFNAIINGTKRIEVRANTKNHDYDKFNCGDKIRFTNTKNDTIICDIEEINHYSSVEELLTMEGTRYTTSSTNDYKEAIDRIYSLNGYRDEVKKSGIYAIHIKYIYPESDVWSYLYNIAIKTNKENVISDTIESGGVAATILTKNGNIYKGVCIDASCSIGMCAERNAIANMITNNEFQIDKLVCVDNKNNLMLPCGVCRELMMQLGNNNENLEILIDINNNKTIKLKELMPNWWYEEKNKATS